MAVKPVSNGDALCQRGDRHQEKQGKSNRSWTRALRLKKGLDLANGLDLKPTWHLRLPQHLKSAACGANLTATQLTLSNNFSSLCYSWEE